MVFGAVCWKTSDLGLGAGSMSTDSHREECDAPDAVWSLSPDAERYIAVLRAYFGFQAYAGVLAAVLLPFSLLLGGPVKITGSPWITLPLFAVNTWAAFRTRRLLLERRRDGALMGIDMTRRAFKNT